jgi:hypothetical protein
LVVNIFILREENERKEAIAFIGLRDENGTQLGPATESHKHSGKGIRISSSWRSIGESHVEGSWPLMKSNDEKV